MLISGMRLSLKARLALCALVVVILSAVFFRGFWLGLPAMLSPERILGQNQASPWGVLGLCFIFLWLKRKEVWAAMQPGPGFVFIPAGLALIAGALLVPVSSDFQAFQVLLVFLGVFAVFFGKGAKIPVILMAIYGFTIAFPLLVQHFAGDAYARTAIVPLKGIITLLGYPFAADGALLHLTTAKGDLISVMVTVACAGPATMGVFLSIFALMTLDMPLPRGKAAWLLLFGVFGTWLQNLIRVTILMVVGYYMGEDALWAAHSWTIYLLFPLWYFLFAYIYFRQFGTIVPANHGVWLAGEVSVEEPNTGSI